MKLSRRGEYALKALMQLASLDITKGSTTPEIARKSQIPEPFLNQILLALKNAGILRSRRGTGGGYVLNKEPDAITLGEVARLMDGPLAPVPCASVTAYEPCPSCTDPTSCNLRLLMRKVRDAISQIENNQLPAADVQSVQEGQYYSFPNAKEVTNFLENGWKILDNKEYLEFMNRYCEIGPEIFDKLDEIIYENTM